MTAANAAKGQFTCSTSVGMRGYYLADKTSRYILATNNQHGMTGGAARANWHIQLLQVSGNPFGLAPDTQINLTSSDYTLITWAGAATQANPSWVMFPPASTQTCVMQYITSDNVTIVGYDIVLQSPVVWFSGYAELMTQVPQINN